MQDAVPEYKNLRFEAEDYVQECFTEGYRVNTPEGGAITIMKEKHQD